MDWVTPKSINRYAPGKINPPLHTFRKNSSPSPPPPQPPSSSGSKHNPAVLFAIIIIAVIFFVAGLIFLIVRFVKNRRPLQLSTSSPQPNDGGESNSEALQRQLQQLFHLPDSGLDQSVIDALPVFLYGELVGAKEPFDCAVCLCEFSNDDKLRLLPVCSHAFHINCIDTWLQSNSSCPLCRDSLFIENHPLFNFDEPQDEESTATDCDDGAASPARKPLVSEECDGNSSDVGEEDKLVLPVRLGKFKSLVAETTDTDGDAPSVVVVIDSQGGGVVRDEGEASSSSSIGSSRDSSSGSSSCCNSSSRRSKGLDERRCYSMGSYQYVEGDSILTVALSRNLDGRSGRRKGVGVVLDSIGEEGVLQGKRLFVGSKGESFSVSKIWQWGNKKGKLPLISDRASLEGGLSRIKRDERRDT